MSRHKRKPVIEDVEIEQYAAEGKSLFRINGKVIFVKGVVPGDRINTVIKKSKSDYGEGICLKVTTPSPDRIEPFCSHFGSCGGCQWQMLEYEKQLTYKFEQVKHQMKTIAKQEVYPIQPIIGCASNLYYRNKLEFTFSNKKFLTSEDILDENISSVQNVLGFHAKGFFDKVVDIRHCFLMNDLNNQIRNYLRELSFEKQYTFYDIRNHLGWLRNVIIRINKAGECMLNLIVTEENMNDIKIILDSLINKFPKIITTLYTINSKMNDSIFDLEPKVYHGQGFLVENLGKFNFLISPKSFFQTNSEQAEILYQKALDMADLKGHEVLYDIYCGTGSIGIFMSNHVQKIIGVELIEDAIADAKINASLNKIEDKCNFFVGDATKICNQNFFTANGRPDIIVLDPPRNGLTNDLINTLLQVGCEKILYISCNPSTQARDLFLLSPKYDIVDMCPVDMFPHTHHIENIVMLKLKNKVDLV